MFYAELLSQGAELKEEVYDFANYLSARLLKKPIVGLANSPGPFRGRIKKYIAKIVFNNFTLITTREPLSADILHKLGVRTPIITTACPAFLLETAKDNRIKEIIQLECVNESDRPIIGVTLCGYNFYSKPTWDVPETFEDLELYVPLIRFLLNELHAQVLLIPHVYRTNSSIGQRIQGPDYIILKTLSSMVSRYNTSESFKVIKGIYSPSEVKGLVGRLDLYISGRLHAGVAALSQYVPTILLAYGHKHFGFAKMLKIEEYVWQQSSGADGLVAIVGQIWEDRERVKAKLHKWVPIVKESAELNVKILRDIVKLDENFKSRLPQNVVDRWKAMV